MGSCLFFLEISGRFLHSYATETTVDFIIELLLVIGFFACN